MIWDGNDDPVIDHIVDVEPILIAPHASTPMLLREERPTDH